MAKGEKIRILVVDDEENVRHYLQLFLTREGFDVSQASDASEALDCVADDAFAIILCDIRMPGGMDGLGLLDELQGRALGCDVIMMSAYGSRETAIEAVRRGAYDYINKPIQTDDLLLTIHKLLERKRLHRENRKLREVLGETNEDCGIVTRAPVFQEALKSARRAAMFPSSILIRGETGTGKSLLAKAIHKWSDRRDKSLIEVNCAAIPANLLESELFGYVKGAFTGATRDHEGLLMAADKGTLFLDEIGDIPMDIQVKLLRVLEESKVRRVGETKARPIDVRFIAATHRDLETMVGEGEFRSDLYHRLDVIKLRIPPLRERPEDIPLLAETQIKRFNASYRTTIEGVTPEAMKLLMAYEWEGNIRELKNVIESGIVQESGSMLSAEALPRKVREPGPARPMQGGHADELWIPPDMNSIKQVCKEVEFQLIKRVLKQTGGNKSAAAKILEISLRALIYKVKEYEL
jgi:two-component system response regulator AtoC